MKKIPLLFGTAACIPPALLTASIYTTPGAFIDPRTFFLGMAFFLTCLSFLITQENPMTGQGGEKHVNA